MNISFINAKINLSIIEKDLKDKFPQLQKLDMIILILILNELKSVKGMPSVKKLAQLAGVSSSHVSKIKDRLREEKLITIVNDPEDMRIKLIGLTALGQRLTQKICTTLDEICEKKPIYGTQ